MQISVDMTGHSFLRTLLGGALRETDSNVRKALHKICVKWVFEAKLRVPVDTGLLRNTILKEVGLDAQGYYGAVGSNQKYAKYLEYGTKWIAKGLVKALGLRDDVTDAQAVHTWPAKMANATDKTSVRVDREGSLTAGRLRNRKGQFLKGRPQEQMPWLRPSWMKIRDWALQTLADAFKFPGDR